MRYGEIFHEPKNGTQNPGAQATETAIQGDDRSPKYMEHIDASRQNGITPVAYKGKAESNNIIITIMVIVISILVISILMPVLILMALCRDNLSRIIVSPKQDFNAL